MAIVVGTRVRVADENSDYRKQTGEVISIDTDADPDIYNVRLDGYGCNQTVPLQLISLQENVPASPVDHSNC